MKRCFGYVGNEVTVSCLTTSISVFYCPWAKICSNTNSMPRTATIFAVWVNRTFLRAGFTHTLIISHYPPACQVGARPIELAARWWNRADSNCHHLVATEAF